MIKGFIGSSIRRLWNVVVLSVEVRLIGVFISRREMRLIVVFISRREMRLLLGTLGGEEIIKMIRFRDEYGLKRCSGGNGSELGIEG
jgi:hypothetical protein